MYPMLKEARAMTRRIIRTGCLTFTIGLFAISSLFLIGVTMWAIVLAVLSVGSL